MFQPEYFSQDPAQKLGHIVLCTVLGVKQERKGEEKRE